MAIETVPLLREDSILAWDIKGTNGTVRGIPGVSAAATWQSLGRVMEWDDLGPENQIYRDAIAGSGREASTIGAAGVSYKPKTLSPFQVVDPRFLGFFWGREVSVPSPLGGGYYRHTATPTNRGALPYMDVQMADYKAGVFKDGFTFLDVIMSRLSLRGEETSEDGDANSGRVLAAPTLLPHDHTSAVATKAVSLSSSEPYYKQHAAISFYNSDTDWRVHSWEFAGDNLAKHNYYHSSSYNGKPAEAPPEGVTYDLSLDIVADAHQNATSGYMIRDLLANQTKGNVQLKYIRTLNQDEFALNLNNFIIEEAPKKRRSGKIHYDIKGYAQTSSFEWVDQNSARYFPS